MLYWLFFRRYLFSPHAGALVRRIAKISIVGITVGIAALVLVLSIIKGFNQVHRTRILSVYPHLIAEVGSTSSEMPHALNEDGSLSQAKLQKLTENLDVTEIMPFERQDVILRNPRGNFNGAVAMGLAPQALYQMFQRVRLAVRDPGMPVLSMEEADLKEDEVVIGADLARSMDVIEGDYLVVIPPDILFLPSSEVPLLQRVKIKALIYSQVAEIDATFLFYGLNRGMAKLKESSSLVRGYEFFLKDPFRFKGVKKVLEGSGLKVQTWIDQNASLFFALRVERIIMTLFLSLAAIITSFSILTVLILLMMQKKKDMGILLASGMTPKDVQKLFLQIGLTLTGLGLFSGVALGLVFCLILQIYPLEILPAIYYDRYIPVQIAYEVIGIVLLCGAVLAYYAIRWPVRKYTLLSPAQALRR